MSLIPPSLSCLHFRADSLNSFLPSIQLLFPLLQAQNLTPLFKKVFRKRNLLSIHLNLLSHLTQLLVDSTVLETFQTSNPLPLLHNDFLTLPLSIKAAIFLLFSILLANSVCQVWCFPQNLLLPFFNSGVSNFFSQNLSN